DKVVFALLPGAALAGSIFAFAQEKRQGSARGFDPRAVPHMTLLDDTKSFADVVLEEPIVMPVTDFVLVRSLYGKAESRRPRSRSRCAALV
ncbi:hypothetical protein, partial [Streptococcus pneumoniae]|uniref:hypothetical protein n=1 Tax=Streptococcus pneumoniae TaxID=1313 RepID=UPI0019545157